MEEKEIKNYEDLESTTENILFLLTRAQCKSEALLKFCRCLEYDDSRRNAAFKHILRINKTLDKVGKLCVDAMLGGTVK